MAEPPGVADLGPRGDEARVWVPAIRSRPEMSGSEIDGPDAAERRGRFIVLEGVEASGKSTHAVRLAAELGALLTREPGGTPLGERLRALVLDPGSPPVSARAEALLMLAARAQHVEEVIRPALNHGRDVVCDRFSASTIAYQGHGRGLDPIELARLSEWAAAGIAPDRVILLDVAPHEVARRLAARRRTPGSGGDAAPSGGGGSRKEREPEGRPDRGSGGGFASTVDRIESEEAEFFERVAAGFFAQARSDPERWRVVDGLGSLDEVAARVAAAACDDG